MNETISIFIIGIVLFAVIAEIFGRSKHIGRWWAFALLVSTLVFGVVAIIVSPSAKGEPTEGNQIHKYSGYILIGLGILSMAINPYPIFLGFIVLGVYLIFLSKGEIINENPKFYFDNLKTNPKKSTKKSADINVDKVQSSKSKIFSIHEQKYSLKILLDKGVLNQSEYQEKIKSLDERIKIEIVKKTSEYLNLKKLYDDGVFTKAEFESKFEELKSNINFTKEKVNTNKAEEKVNTNKAKEKVNINKTKINLNNLIGVWGYENNIFEFLHSGDFFFKINSFYFGDSVNYLSRQAMFNREVSTGRWLLFENEKCIINMDESDVKIEPLVIENQKLKIRLNSEILICEKINDEI